LVLALLLAGCSTLATQKSSYKELTSQGFVALVKDQPAPGLLFFYGGSDDNYDYIYTEKAVVLADVDYHEYKMKRGILNLPKRFDFNPVANPPNGTPVTNYSFVYGARNEEELKAELRKLVNEEAASPASSTPAK
jgi:hypothetical protein